MLENSSPPVTLAKRRIIIVDDNPDILAMTAELLALKGYETHTAADAVSGLELAETIEPDVAFLDIGLPVIDGYELGRKLRELFPDLRLYAVTGYGQAADGERSLEAGFDDHIVKPISLERLEALLNF